MNILEVSQYQPVDKYHNIEPVIACNFLPTSKSSPSFTYIQSDIWDVLNIATLGMNDNGNMSHLCWATYMRMSLNYLYLLS